MAARATLTRSSVYPNNIALWWNNRALDVPIFFAGGDRLSETVDILAALEGRYAQGETNSAWIDFGQGRNGIANYSPDLPAEEQGEFAVSISIELLAVRQAGGGGLAPTGGGFRPIPAGEECVRLVCCGCFLHFLYLF